YPAELVHQLQQRGQQPLRPDGLWPQRLQNVAGAGQDFLRHGAELRQQLARIVRVALAPLFVVLEQRHDRRQVRSESVVDLSCQAAASGVNSPAARSSRVKTSLCSSARRKSPLLMDATPSGAASDSVGTPARSTNRRCSPSVYTWLASTWRRSSACWAAASRIVWRYPAICSGTRREAGGSGPVG